MRLHRNPSPVIYDDSYKFEIGKATVVRKDGDDVALISSGIMLQKALDAADVLKAKGIKARAAQTAHAREEAEQRRLGPKQPAALRETRVALELPVAAVRRVALLQRAASILSAVPEPPVER